MSHLELLRLIRELIQVKTMNIYHKHYPLIGMMFSGFRALKCEIEISWRKKKKIKVF